MPAPLIGISGCHFAIQDGPWAGFVRSGANRDYVEGVRRAGGIPVILPLVPAEPDAIDRLMAGLDGLLLTGGGDVDPAHFGAERHPLCGQPEEGRDEFDLALYAAAKRAGLPVLGICRGLQVMVVAEGGTLHQDLGEVQEVDHDQTNWTTDFRRTVHNATATAGTRTASLLGNGPFPVNSFHHQAADEVRGDLVVSAVSDDGVIEAVESTDGRLLGVQWHPERNDPDHISDAIFGHLIRAASGDLSSPRKAWERVTGRVVPLNSRGDALLMHGFEPSRPDWWFWFTIGGEVDPGETPRQAAARELREETGIVVDEAALGEPVAEQTIQFSWGEHDITQHQVFFTVRLDDDVTVDLSSLDGSERDTIDRCDWVAIEDLESGAEPPVAPELPGHIRTCRQALGLDG